MDNKYDNSNLEEYLFNKFSEYHKSPLGVVSGENLEELKRGFGIHFTAKEIKFDDFKKKILDRFGNLNEVFNFILSLNDAFENSEERKCLNLSINKEDIKDPQTLIDLSISHSIEDRINKLRSVGVKESLYQSPLMIIHFKTSSSQKLKAKLEMAMKLLLIIIKQKFTELPNKFLDYFISVDKQDEVTLLLHCMKEEISLFWFLLNDLLQYFKKVTLNLEIKLEIQKSFSSLIDDTNNLKSMILGTNLSVDMTTSSFLLIKNQVEAYSSQSKELAFILSILSYLELDLYLNMKVKETKDLNKVHPLLLLIPNFDIFNSSSSEIKGFIEKLNDLINKTPFAKKVLSMFEDIDNQVEIYLNLPIALVSLKVKTSGLLDCFDVLSTVHIS